MKEKAASFKKALQVYQKRKKLIASFILVFSVIFPFYISIRDIVFDGIPFWYDPARDMLLAWDNLRKFTLIGPPSGIPGIFYGPYWIWSLSFGLLLSKDPRVVDILVLTIPYFTIFPLVLFRFTRIFGRKITVILWFLFIFGYKTYTTFIWNPHLAPLLFLCLVYFLVFTDLNIANRKNYLHMSLAGIFSGLLVNFHISFGIAMMLAAMTFLLIEFFIYSPRRISNIVAFAVGLFLSFIPSIIFELRHGFQQTQTLVTTVSNAFLFNSAVVGQVGLSKTDILREFLKIPDKLLHIQPNITLIVFLIILVHFLIRFRLYARVNIETRKLLLFLAISVPALFLVFLTSKNPVWPYHFIAAEIIVLLFFGFILTRFSLVRTTLIAWVMVLMFSNIYELTKPAEVSSFRFSDLATKKHIVDTIYKDSQSKPFAVSAYSSAIYTYDYDYIFRWFATDKYPGQIPKDPREVKFVYLIIPQTSEDVKTDFINYKTSNEEYRTVKDWQIPDGTTILKRERI